MSAMALPRGKFGTTTTLALCVALTVVFASMRAVGVLGPTQLRFLLPLGFVLMAIAPWALLTPVGRREIGFRRPLRRVMYLYAVVLGAAAALACFVIGLGLFGTGTDNWFVSIATNFGQSVNGKFSVLQMYLMFTVPSMIFSPIGEEIFFRGLLQGVLEEHFSIRISTWIECLAFGLIHLCHHGLIIGAAGVTLLPRSAPIWFALMVMVAWLFAWLRQRSRSLYPAMAAHAAFNFMMGTGIFVALWPVGSGL